MSAVLVADLSTRGEVGAVAPVLAGAEEEDLDAGLARPPECRAKTSASSTVSRVDALVSSEMEDRARMRSRTRAARLELHVLRQPPASRPTSRLHPPPGSCRSGTACASSTSSLCSRPRRDQVGAGRRAALDLVQHAGPRAGSRTRCRSRSASRNAFCRMLTVRLTAQVEAKGPK